MGDEEGNCSYVCDSNITQFLESSGLEPNGETNEVVRIKLLTSQFGEWVELAARLFEEYKNGTVRVEMLEIPHPELLPNIINEAKSQLGLFDIFVAPSTYVGSIQEYGGWADLTSFVEESVENLEDWNDLFLGYRKWIAQFEGKILNYPLDGDLLSMFYRKDVLKFYNLTVPRTWDEYNGVAAFLHGKTFENQTLTGSCVGRLAGCGGPYWANLLWSSITQTQGAWSGHILDTDDMKILSGPALQQVIIWLEGQAIHGDPLEFDMCILRNTVAMKEGTCALTYNWGNTFKQYLKQPSILEGRFGVARAPGSQYVLDRETMELVKCDEKLCRYGTYHEDLGWVNRAPYMAGGGWTCAVNNYTATDERRRLATEFCAFASSQGVSVQGVIPDANGNNTQNGQDPFRMSHMDTARYASRGYETEAAQEYLDTIREDLNSENVVVDLRFPTGFDLYAVMDLELHDHLNQTRLGLIPPNQLASRRRSLANRVETAWKEAISDYDKQSTTRESLLIQYQRLRGVYKVDVDMNQLSLAMRAVALTLFSLVMFCTISFAAWTIYARKSYIVKASQPFFLVMLCGGVAVLSAAIVPFSIDDSVVSVDGASSACMAIPWLLSIGWTTIFSVLAAKLLRVNKVFQNSIKFRRVKISIRDVLLPFAVLLTWNVVVLIAWTITDPIGWIRIETSEASSVGSCSSGNDKYHWKIYTSFMAIPNAISLLFANYEAYKSRLISTEFGESKWIAMAMVSILQILLVGIPLLFLVNENPTAEFFVRTAIVFVISMSILLLMFVPKVLAWYNDPKASSNTKTRSNRTGRTPSHSSSIVNGGGLKVYQWQTSSELSKLRNELATSRDLVDALKQRLQEHGIDANGLEKEAEYAGRATSMYDSSVGFDNSASLIDRMGAQDSSQSQRRSSARLQSVVSSLDNILVMEEEDTDVKSFDEDEEAEKSNAMLEPKYSAGDVAEEAKEPC